MKEDEMSRLSREDFRHKLNFVYFPILFFLLLFAFKNKFIRAQVI